MGRLGKMIMHLKMMGYEMTDDLNDPKCQEITVKLVLSEGLEVATKVSRQDLLHTDFIIERIVKDLNHAIKEVLS